MPDDGEQRPDKPPEYNVYRSRRGILSRLRSADLAALRERAKLPSRRTKTEEGAPPPPGDGGSRWPDLRPGDDEGRKVHRPRRSRPGLKRALKWVGIAALGWILISFLAFAVSAQLQSFKLSGEAKETLHGNPFLLPSAQTILVLGTDARPPDTKEPGAAPSEKCFEQQANGDAPHGECSEGEFRADTLMLIRAGGGAFRKLSIPRDAFAEIPGQAPTKINAAYAFGGAALQIKTIENFLNLEIDHVAIIDFTGFEDLIDAVGGVTVDVPNRLCADISGGAGGGQGGTSLRLGKGENTLNGEKALVYARVRKPSECPGTAPSAFTLGYDDLDRAKAQQAVINGIKDRLTDPLRAPYNFIHGPLIGWDAPKAFVSDMGFFTMPQLVLAAGIGGSAPANVLCGNPNAGCGEGPESSIEVPESVRRAAVKRFLDG
ncbi:MAG TPA: LCP family protein [Solirubrobacterales bacterium]